MCSCRLGLCIFAAAVGLITQYSQAAGQTHWQAEWDKTLRAAESEGQLTLYGCCYDFDRVIEGFKNKYPRIKVAMVLGFGNQLATRILAERRGDRFLMDVVSSGANSLHDVLYKGQILDPIKPALVLPEVLDVSKWYEGEHRYIDPEKRYIFAFVANSQSGQIVYNLKQANPAEFKSHWDLLHPKWKGKMVSLDPTCLGMGATLQFFISIPISARRSSRSSTARCKWRSASMRAR